jgi:hypothetical protein
VPTDRLSATDRARLHELRRELLQMFEIQEGVTELFTASATAYRERTGKNLSVTDPPGILTEADKLRALELFRASRSQVGKV